MFSIKCIRLLRSSFYNAHIYFLFSLRDMNKNQTLYFSLYFTLSLSLFLYILLHLYYIKFICIILILFSSGYILLNFSSNVYCTVSHKNLCLWVCTWCTQVLYIFTLLNSDPWVSADAMLKSRRSYLALNRSREYPLSLILPCCEENAHAYSRRISLFVSHTIRILLEVISAG